MSSNHLVSRRGVLAAGAAGIAGAAGAAAALAGGGAVLTGCGSGGGCTRWDPEYEPRAASGSSTSTGGGAVLTALTDVDVGHAVTARTPAGDPVIVTRPGADEVVAFSARCPHKGCLVTPDGTGLRCAPHDARFDLATGAVEAGPPKKALARVEVAVRNGQVVMAG